MDENVHTRSLMAYEIAVFVRVMDESVDADVENYDRTTGNRNSPAHNENRKRFRQPPAASSALTASLALGGRRSKLRRDQENVIGFRIQRASLSSRLTPVAHCCSFRAAPVATPSIRTQGRSPPNK
jgi:hypothetical protein